jgi:hypothetical protein
MTLFVAPPAHAGDAPDFVTFGFGGYDFDKNQGNRQSVDYRLEYQNGISLLPLISHRLNSADHCFQIHPTVGFEGNTKGTVFANSGLNLDVPFLRHGIFTWGEVIGLYGQGNDARTLGSVVQFRSQLELGWRFNNELRLTGFVSHISNAHLAQNDTGAEIAGAYVHVPLSLLGMK